MEGRGPYRIYDPGGSIPPGEASTAFERLVEENSRLKEKMQGIKMLGELLEESQMEASRLRQKAEALVEDSELGKDRQLLPPPSPTLTSFDHLPELTGKDANVPAPPTNPAPPSDKPEPVQKPPSSGTSSEFEVVPNEQNSPPESSGQTRNMMELGPLPHEDSNLMLHLQRLETTLSVCAEEPDHSQLFTHLGRMALEFNRLASKVHKNEQRTSILQTLCEQLRKENETLKAKLDKGLEQRDQAAERLREENMELKKLLMTSGKEGVCRRPGSPKMEGAGKKGVAGQLQASATASKIPEAGALGAAEKKVKVLEQQRTETDKEQLSAEAKELRQKVRYLQDQLSPLTRQRDYQEKEIQRLNKALEEALSIQASPSSPTAFGNTEGAGGLLRKQELVTQNELLKQQVKIFEEDFQRERSDRERMNEEKEELKKQLKAFKDEEKAKEALKQQKRKAKASAERYHVEPHPYFGYYGPPMPHHGYEEWSQIRYPPPPMAMEHPPPLPNSHLYPMPGYTWRPPYGGMRNQTSQVMDSPTARPAEPDSAKNDRKGPQ
uniref:TNFAIP3-interacting protein 1 n=1 Tax=Myotis myotis TaxID=51298 RepID=A0A7J7XL51_MYOMY|nr:TNFAIP3 interacting protein 1 [Myotis myotis]